MDVGSAGVREGQDGTDTKPSTATGGGGGSVWFLRVLNRAVLPKHGQGRLRGAACASHGGRRDSRWSRGEEQASASTEAESDG